MQDDDFDKDETFVAMAFDTQFNYLTGISEKQRMEDAYYEWLVSKFRSATLDTIYLAGSSRGGCLSMRLAKRFNREYPRARLIVQTYDGVCNENQGELNTWLGAVDNPASKNVGRFAWATDLRFQYNQSNPLSIFQVASGAPAGQVIGHAFIHVEGANESKYDIDWYRHQWVDMKHIPVGRECSLGACKTDVTKLALNFLSEKLDTLQRNPTCECANGAQRCRYGGSFDGSHCSLGKPPAGSTASTRQGYYTYSPIGDPYCADPGLRYLAAEDLCVGKHPDDDTAAPIYPSNACPKPGTDLANGVCRYRKAPSAISPFVRHNRWYYSSCVK